MNVETPTQRPWYKKKRYILPTTAIAGLLLFGAGGDAPTQIQDSQVVAPSVPAVEHPTNTNPPAPATNSGLSNDDYYINTYGDRVHSPAYSESGEIPVGASARCRDGTYSFSQSRRGTCSHHGGVAEWY